MESCWWRQVRWFKANQSKEGYSSTNYWNDCEWVGKTGNRETFEWSVQGSLKEIFWASFLAEPVQFHWKDSRGKWKDKDQARVCGGLQSFREHLKRLWRRHSLSIFIKGEICNTDRAWSRLYWYAGWEQIFQEGLTIPVRRRPLLHALLPYVSNSYFWQATRAPNDWCSSRGSSSTVNVINSVLIIKLKSHFVMKLTTGLSFRAIAFVKPLTDSWVRSVSKRFISLGLWDLIS